jgi:hypothetical protein
MSHRQAGKLENQQASYARERREALSRVNIKEFYRTVAVSY